jgi:hypothetical protein
MSTKQSSDAPTPTPTRERQLERLTDVRLQVGAVHWDGARPITHLTTDRSKVSVSGTFAVLADELLLHPAGCLVKINGDSGGTWIIPHARVETYRLA